jgi:hypothetical protein
MKRVAVVGAVVGTVILASAVPRVFALGETGAQFLKIGVGTRACAMGEAYTALSSDATGIYWNPAGLARVASTEITAMHNSWLMDMGYQYAAVAAPTGFGGLGVAVAYSSSGDIPKIEDFQHLGEYSAYDASGTLGVGMRWGRAVSYGLGLKLIHQKIEEETATGFAVDLGLIAKMPSHHRITVGFVIQNLGPEIQFINESDPLPMNVKVGAGYVRGPVTFATDVVKPRDDDVRVGVGGELVLKGVLALRGGYNSANTYTAGVGLMWRSISVGYAFVPYEAIDDSHRIAATLRL